MALKEEIVDTLNHQTWVLKVSIHCEGCKKKVKKILKSINGVHFVDVDAKQNKVTVTGDVDAEILIRRLAKSGKHADMWPEKKPANPNPNPNPNPKEKNKEKESEPAAEVVAAAAAAAAAAATEKTPAVTNAEPAAKPAETPKKPEATAAEPAEKEAPKTTGKEVAKPDKEPADTTTETDTKQAAASDQKKVGKQGDGPSGSEGHSGNSTHTHLLPAYQVPVYQHPVYAVSHNTTHPMASNSYYYAPTPSMPQSYAHSGGNPYPGYDYNQTRTQPYPEYYPYYYSSESYYGSYSDPRASPSRSQGQGSIDMFNDENANGCTIM